MKKCRTSPPQSYAGSHTTAGLLACVSSSGAPSRFSLRTNGLCAFVHAYSRGKTAPDFHRLPDARLRRALRVH